MPKIRVKPRASRAYCAPRLNPMVAACRNSAIASGGPAGTNQSFRLGFLAFDAHVLAVLDDANAEREEQSLSNAEVFLAGPVAFTDVGVLNRHRAQNGGNLFRIVGPYRLQGLHGHTRARQIGPERGASDRIAAQ